MGDTASDREGVEDDDICNIQKVGQVVPKYGTVSRRARTREPGRPPQRWLWKHHPCLPASTQTSNISTCRTNVRSYNDPAHFSTRSRLSGTVSSGDQTEMLIRSATQQSEFIQKLLPFNTIQFIAISHHSRPRHDTNVMLNGEPESTKAHW